MQLFLKTRAALMAWICQGLCVCRSRDNLVPDSQIFSSRHSTVPNKFSVQLYTNAPGSLQAVCQELQCLVCILRAEQAACGMRGFSLNFASIQHILLFIFSLLHSLITSSCADSCLRNTEVLRFLTERTLKNVKIWIRECFSNLRKIWLTEFFWAGTLLFVINNYSCNKLRFRFNSIFLHQI